MLAALGPLLGLTPAEREEQSRADVRRPVLPEPRPQPQPVKPAPIVALPLLPGEVASEPTAEPVEPPVRFAVISDLHVMEIDDPELDPPSIIPPALPLVINGLLPLEPEFVVLTGDLTSGNRERRHPDRTIRRWWNELTQVLDPLRQAGIGVVPVAGNHEQYHPEHIQAYRDWGNLDAWLGPLAPGLRRDPNNADDAPLYYSVDYRGLHLALLNVPGRHLDDAQLEWLAHDLHQAASGTVRLAFGHLPLVSAMGSSTSNSRLLRDLGAIFAAGHVSAYFAGHEHLVWDDYVHVGAHRMRHVISGVGGAVYRFRINANLFREHCEDDLCVLPTGEYQFRAPRGRQASPASCVLVEVDAAGELTVIPHELHGTELVPFARAGQVATALTDAPTP